jgi:hemerythrin-like domain-containing protein
MITEKKKDEHDGVLTASLAEIVARLRSGPYGPVVDPLEEAQRGAADPFVATLAAHLRHEEEVLFPEILRASPESAAEIGRLHEEHLFLRVYATDLAYRMKEGDREGAYEVSRAFLAALFDHIDLERKVVDARLKTLPA